MKLSIIIVSYNTKEVLQNCLHSIYSSSTKSSFETIVVDNHSTDGSVEMMKTEFPQVKLILNQENRLFAKANNQGAAIAQGEYLLLLNSDTLVYDDNLDKMIAFFDTLPEKVICIGPKVLNPDKTLQSQGWPLPSRLERFCMCFKIGKLFPFAEKILPIKGLPEKRLRTKQVGWVVGACMMVRAKAYKAIGGLNENIEFYGEEPEFGYRSYKKYGYTTWFYPGAEIIHLGGVSTNKVTHKVDDETRLRRYALLQRETVGYRSAIQMSRIVIFAAYVKRLISPPQVHVY